MELVKSIQGIPDKTYRYLNNSEEWYYGNCEIMFKDKVVESYNNTCGSLRIK